MLFEPIEFKTVADSKLIVFKFVQFEKAYDSIFSSLSLSSTDSKDVQFEKAAYPIVFIGSRNFTLVIVLFPANALFAIAITGYPLIKKGILTTSAEPV